MPTPLLPLSLSLVPCWDVVRYRLAPLSPPASSSLCDAMQHCCELLMASCVAARLPRGEREPRPEGSERVVFLSHFKRGFGLPASGFFRDFLEFFGLQPHHLGVGAIVQLSGFVTLYEGYLGVEPSIDLWVRFFSLK